MKYSGGYFLFTEKDLLNSGKTLSTKTWPPGSLTWRSLRAEVLSSGAAGCIICEELTNSSSIKGNKGSTYSGLPQDLTAVQDTLESAVSGTRAGCDLLL